MVRPTLSACLVPLALALVGCPPPCGYDDAQQSERDLADSTRPVFRTPVVALDDLLGIFPSPNTSGHILKVHSYMKVDHEVDVVAPADMTLVAVDHYDQGGSQYKLDFDVGCRHRMYLDHIDTPIDAIRDLVTTDHTVGELRFLEGDERIEFSEGDLLGTTGNLTSGGSWDFGLLDARRRNDFVNQERYEDELRSFLHGMCPFDLYTTDLRVAYADLFMSVRGEPLPQAACGDGSQDVAGTLAGTWFTVQGDAPAPQLVIYSDIDGTIATGGLTDGEGVVFGPFPETRGRGCFTVGAVWVWLELDPDDDTRLLRSHGDGPCPADPPEPTVTYAR